MRDLGAHLSFGARLVGTTIRSRFNAGVEAARRLQSLPTPIDHRVQAVLGKVLPLSLYGAPATPIPKRSMDRLRTALVEVVDKGAANSRN
eukprot:5299081-Alexandrium_andersonii.AAC.1